MYKTFAKLPPFANYVIFTCDIFDKLLHGNKKKKARVLKTISHIFVSNDY